MSLKKVLAIAAELRLFILALQYVANYLIPDHNAHVFQYPPPDAPKNIWDTVIHSLFDGLTRWDGQYFMHLALYGYTYENSLAFFPFLPFYVQFLANNIPIPFINHESKVLLFFAIFNFVIFLLSTCMLYVLTDSWFGKHKAYLTSLIFCMNPASIFFSAAYTECLFSLLTFASIYCCWKLDFRSLLVGAKWLFLSCVMISASTITRSNGLLNLGFLAYFFVRNLRLSLLKSNSHIVFKLIKLSWNIVILLMAFIICVFPFAILQFDHHDQFCTDIPLGELHLPQEVISHALVHKYRIVGQFYNQSWCNFTWVPLPYSYVQEKYWNVGLFKYYQWKQIPNFLLALPVIYITLTESIRFLIDNKSYCIHLGIFKATYAKYFERPRVGDQEKEAALGSNQRRREQEENEKDLLFVCVVHALFLCVFCICFVHIQVTTRMLFSASPAIYWFSLNKSKKFIKLYCFVYYFIGTALFCNFYPWT